MQKTKLGLSVGLVGALLYACGLFGDWFIIIAAVAYVLILEENIWLKKTAVKALLLAFLFPVLRTVIGVVPDLIGVVEELLSIFNVSFRLAVVTGFFNMLRSIVSIAEYIVMIALGICALSQATVHIPLVDDLINKHMD